MKPLFSLNDLSFSYDGKTSVFDHINLDLMKDEVVLLTCENGSGKSTLCNILSKNITAGKGKFLFEEKEFSKIDRFYLFSKILYIKEQTQQNLLGATPEEDIAIWQHRFTNKDSKHLKEERAFILKKFKLDTIADKPLWECSAGQQKRTVLTSLLLNSHKYWILDEPLYSLDKEGSKILLSLLVHHKINRQGALIATNKPDTFAIVADRIIEVSAGTISG